MWEQIDPETWRLRVWNGWIVRYDTISWPAGEAVGSTMTFVPDMLHQWKLSKEGK